MDERAALIARMEDAYRKGNGVRLSHAELGLLHAKPVTEEPPDIVIAGRESATRLDVHIRWMIRRDLPDVMEIEQSSFDPPWEQQRFLDCLRQRSIVFVAEAACGRIVGFMVYELYKSRIVLLNMAVAPEARRRGVGAQMAGRLIEKLSQQRRNEVLVEVRERNVPAQQFFAAQGFHVLNQHREHFLDTGEDCYVLGYRRGGPVVTDDSDDAAIAERAAEARESRRKR